VLHSSLPDARGRWTLFGAEPFESYRGRDYESAVRRWRELAKRNAGGEPPAVRAPFMGGAVGYWAYDFGRRLERLPAHAVDDLGLPDFVLGLYDVVGAHDHATGQTWLFSSGLPEEGAARHARADERLDRLTRLLEAPARDAARIDRPRLVRLPGALRASSAAGRSTFDRDGYCRAVLRIQDLIARGDLFQANLSQRWTLPLVGQAGPLGSSALDGPGLSRASTTLHRALADRSPAPFSAWLLAGDHAIVSASPERFLELRGGRVETRPIKGTRPRGATAAEDARLRAELEASEKDRAENVMIVDVLRNDLGRVCDLGTVIVPSLCELEAFPQVFHLTSTVQGRLRGEHDAFDLLHACFPGGSITGAPKIRAMEVLDGLEPVRRHVYTGSVGYVDWSGNADWSIAIRTALVTPDAVHAWAGGGITADSDPEAEYEETLHKAAGLSQALDQAFGLSLDLGPVPA